MYDIPNKIPPSFEKMSEPVEELKLVHNTGVRGYHFIIGTSDKESNRMVASEEGFIHYYFNNRWYCLIGSYNRDELWKNNNRDIDNGKLIKDIIKDIRIIE